MTDKHTPYSLSDWLNLLSHKEIDFLTDLAKSLPDNPHVVNIGAGAGTSGLAFLLSRPDLRLTTIDIETGPHPTGGLENERAVLEANGVNYSERYTTMTGDSKQLGYDLNKALDLDMVLIDGDHSYYGCLGDIRAWLPHLKPSGILACHDYHKVEAWTRDNPTVKVTPELVAKVIKPYPGVDKAVDELLLGRFPHVNTVYSLIAFIK
jgi:predicted O-methyltransferase YrrM